MKKLLALTLALLSALSFTAAFAFSAPQSQSTDLYAVRLEDPEYFVDGAIYQLSPAAATSLCFDIDSASVKNGANAIVWQNDYNDNQFFTIYEYSDGAFFIESMNSGKVLTVSGGKGSHIVQQTRCKDDRDTKLLNKQLFYFIWDDKGGFRIRSLGGYYIGVSGGNMKKGTNLIAWTKATDSSQRFVMDVITE